jgi:ABC-type dipeptide/oligopeptide/nickel transport system ATPase component
LEKDLEKRHDHSFLYHRISYRKGIDQAFYKSYIELRKGHFDISPEIIMSSGDKFEVILSVNDLHIEFHDHKLPQTAVEDFDLELSRGEIVGIVGESGSGKSLSALAIAGLLSRHDMYKSGCIMFEGEDLLTCNRRKLRTFQGDEISMIFQEPMTSLNPVKKIGWQTEESLRIHHPEIDKKERRLRAISMLAKVGLHEPEKVYDMYPHELSGGMR